MEKEREILYYEDYFIDFFMSLDDGAKKKVSYVLDMLKTQERLNKNFVKLIRDGLYELRASHNRNIYRAFFIFDDGNIVMLFNGFQKKAQKTPNSEIEKALKIMQANPKIGSMDAVLDKLYGKVGSPEREEFRKEAYSYCVGQIISDARKQEKMTQSELAEKVGTNKTYISRIEKGIIEPGVGLFFRIIDALGLKIEIVKPIM